MRIERPTGRMSVYPRIKGLLVRPGRYLSLTSLLEIKSNTLHQSQVLAASALAIWRDLQWREGVIHVGSLRRPGRCKATGNKTTLLLNSDACLIDQTLRIL